MKNLEIISTNKPSRFSVILSVPRVLFLLVLLGTFNPSATFAAPGELVKSFAGTGVFDFKEFTNVDGTLFFFGLTAGQTSGGNLWKSDGTTAGTVLLKSFVDNNSANKPVEMTDVNGTLFFNSNDGIHGTELWKSDGTVAGTVLVKDIRPGADSSRLSTLVDVNGTLFFHADDGINGFELWKSDGTEAGTVMVKDVYAGPLSSTPAELTNVNGTLFFTAKFGTFDFGLWKSDGTTAGTVLVRSFGSLSSSLLTELTNVNGTLFFQIDSFLSMTLWKSDGTTAGTVIVKSNLARIASTYFFTNVNGTLFFKSSDGVNGFELWKSDGTEAGTVMVKDIAVGTDGSFPAELVNVNGTLFFTANDGVNGFELWKSDGTATGTVMMRDIFTGANSSTPSFLTNVNGNLFLSADSDCCADRELWISDSTSTALVSDDVGNGPGQLIDVNGTLFFMAHEVFGEAELWKLDASPNPFAGVYMGTSQHSAGSLACESGEFAIMLKANGIINLLGIDSIDATVILVEGGFIETNGSFSADDIFGIGTNLIGTFSPTGVSGTFDDSAGCFGTMTGTKKPSFGPLAKAGGFYTGTASGNYSGNGLAGTTSGPINMIIAADGSSFLVTTQEVFGDLIGTLVDGGTLNVSSTGNVSGTLLGNTTIAGSLDMMNFTGNGTFSGSFVAPGIGTFTNSGTWSASRQFPLPLTEPILNDMVLNLPGTGVAVLFNDNSSLNVLHTDTAEAVATADVDGNGEDDVIVSFPSGTGPTSSGGTWISRNQGALTLLDSKTALRIAVGDLDGSGLDDLMLDFGADGLWLGIDDNPPFLLIDLPPDAMAIGDLDNNGLDDMVLSFTGFVGFSTFYVLNFTDFVVLDSAVAETLATADVDGNGEDDVIVSFPGAGTFVSRNQGALTQLDTRTALQITKGDFDGSGQDDLLLDFGADNLWLGLNDTSPTQFIDLPLVSMASGDLDSNGLDDMVLSLTGVGTLMFKNLVTLDLLDPAVALDLATGNVDGN